MILNERFSKNFFQGMGFYKEHEETLKSARIDVRLTEDVSEDLSKNNPGQQFYDVVICFPDTGEKYDPITLPGNFVFGHFLPTEKEKQKMLSSKQYKRAKKAEADGNDLLAEFATWTENMITVEEVEAVKEQIAKEAKAT